MLSSTDQWALWIDLLSVSIGKLTLGSGRSAHRKESGF